MNEFTKEELRFLFAKIKYIPHVVVDGKYTERGQILINKIEAMIENYNEFNRVLNYCDQCSCKNCAREYLKRTR